MRKTMIYHSIRKLITCGIILSGMTLVISLFCYFYPLAGQPAAAPSAQRSEIKTPEPDYLTEIPPPSPDKPELRPAPDSRPGRQTNRDSSGGEATGPAASALPPEPETVTYIEPSRELGHVSELDTKEAVILIDDANLHMAMLDTAIGPMLYYNQGDQRWGSYLYGGADPIKKYGCGPTAVAMIVTSFSPYGYNLTPADLADWSASHGGYAPQSGSYHSLIPDSLSAFGLQVDGVEICSEKNAAELLQSGHILVALMGKGSLTRNGHFIVITKILDNGNVYIADPNSFENSLKEWNLAQLMNELKGSYNSGGPLWAVSIK